MAVPSVFAYLDYRTFLRDWFEARKLADPDYSHGTFADDGGCARSTLANVMSGARTPRAGTLDAFGRAMTLSPSERNYLGMLVDLSSATDLARRHEVMQRILSAERYRQVRVAEREHDNTVLRYMEHWYIPAIRELASLPGFDPDPAWIAATLRPEVSVERVQYALDTLFELDFLRRRSDGSVEVREVRFRTEPEAGQVAADHFHREVVAGLLRQLDTTYSDEQHLVAATITLAPDMVPEAKARLNAVIEQLATVGDDRGPEGRSGGRRVYQVAVQLLVLSEVVGVE